MGAPESLFEAGVQAERDAQQLRLAANWLTEARKLSMNLIAEVEYDGGSDRGEELNDAAKRLNKFWSDKMVPQPVPGDVVPIKP